MLFPVFLLKAQVQQIEYFLDTDPGYGKGINPGIPVSVGNTTNKVFEELTFNAPLNTLQDGIHTLYIRAKSNRGWSQTQSHPFVKMNLRGETANEAIYMEYFFDADPGYGKGISANLPETGDTHTFNPNIQSLLNGIHTLYVRVQNRYGNWSQTMSRPFVKTILPSDLASGLTAVEYYIDTDPGMGKAIITPFSPDVNVLEFTAGLMEIPAGNHTLYLRGKNRIGQWEAMGIHAFSVIVSGIDDITVSELVVYPNPVADLLFIKNENSMIKDIEIVDFNGRMCLKQKIEEGNSIIQVSLSEFPLGIYFVKMTGEKGHKTTKVIKQ